jgi:hypothetical protein
VQVRWRQQHFAHPDQEDIVMNLQHGLLPSLADSPHILDHLPAIFDQTFLIECVVLKLVILCQAQFV